MKQFNIGELARRAGVSVDTVRYYERGGLVTPAGRLASGYRRYGEPELARLQFIRRARALGFSLEDARTLLDTSGERNVPRVKQAAQTRLTEVDRRIAELERIRAGLAALVAGCPGQGRPVDCPILAALSHEA